MNGGVLRTFQLEFVFMAVVPLSSVLSPVYMTQRDYLSEVPAGSCKVCKSLSIALIILFTSAGRAVRVDSRAFPPK